jgi:hypothetical protein
MKTEEKWVSYYQIKGIEAEPVISVQTGEAVGIEAFIGKGQLRAFKCRGFRGKSCTYWDRAIKAVLNLLQLSESYPWVICTLDSFSILFLCDTKEKVYNCPPLLWETKESLPGINPNICFYHRSEPEFKPSSVDYDVLRHCLETYKDFLPLRDAEPFRPVSEDLCVNSCSESWSLRAFIKEFGPIMEFGGFPKGWNNVSEFWPVCRFGGEKKRWVYAYVSLRMRNVDVNILRQRKDYLRIGKLPNGHYLLYDASPKIWERIDLYYDGNPIVGYEASDFVITTNEYGKQGLSLKDGTIVIEPIYDSITRSSCYGNFLAYSRQSDNYTEIFPRTYGEGLICCEQYDKDKRKELGRLIYGWPNIQFYMDKHGKRIVIFDEDWFNKIGVFPKYGVISPSSVCYFTDGYLDIKIEDGNCRCKFRVDRKGNAEYQGSDYYGPEEADLLDDLNYDGYEEMGYWNIQDQGLMEGLDDDPESYGNID